MAARMASARLAYLLRRTSSSRSWIQRTGRYNVVSFMYGMYVAPHSVVSSRIRVASRQAICRGDPGLHSSPGTSQQPQCSSVNQSRAFVFLPMANPLHQPSVVTLDVLKDKSQVVSRAPKVLMAELFLQRRY